MKQNFKLFATLAASAAMMISCQQAEEPTMDKAQEPVVKTRAYGDKNSEGHHLCRDQRREPA